MYDSYKKLNQNDSALINRLIVLNMIKSNNEITRAEIAAKTGLRTSTVSYIIQDLKESNLIKEASVKKERKNGKGNKPFIIQLNNEKNILLGIDLKKGESNLIGMNISNQVIFSHKFDLHFIKPAEIESLLIDIIIKIREEYKEKKILGIGIAAPAVIDPEKKEIILSNVLNINHFILGRQVEDAVGVPVFLENNANASAYGEYFIHYRKDYNYLYFIYFHLNQSPQIKNIGLGSGIIIGGEIYHGELFSAGEIGDIIINAARLTIKQNQDFNEHTSLIDLFEQEHYRRSLPAQQLIRDFGFRIGEAIADTINVINPGIVVIGGDHSFTHEGFFNSLKTGIEKNLVSVLRNKIKISTSFLGEESSAIGAAVLAEKKVLSPDFFRRILYREEAV